MGGNLNIFPRNSSSNFAYRSLREIILFCQFLSGKLGLSNLPDVCFRYLRRRVPPLKRTSQLGFSVVFLRREVLEIVRTIVASVIVLMIDFVSFGYWTKKSLGYYHVNSKGSTQASVLEMYIPVPALFLLPFHYKYFFAPLHAPDPSYSPKATSLVKTFEWVDWNWLPDFGGKLIFGHDGLHVRSLCQEPSRRYRASAARSILQQFCLVRA